MDFQFIQQYIPMYVEAARLTLTIGALGIVLATVVGIRSKMAKGKQLTKEERELLRDNGDTIKLKTRYSDEEIEEQERLKAIFT